MWCKVTWFVRGRGGKDEAHIIKDDSGGGAGRSTSSGSSLYEGHRRAAAKDRALLRVTGVPIEGRHLASLDAQRGKIPGARCDRALVCR